MALMARIQRLRKNLGSSSASKRQDAAKKILARCKQTPALFEMVLPALVEALDDADDKMRRRVGFAIYTAARLKPSLVAAHLAALIRYLDTTFGSERAAVDATRHYGADASLLNALAIIAEKEEARAQQPMIAVAVRILNLPYYHPENPTRGLDLLYAGAVRLLGAIGARAPALIEPHVWLLGRCLIDTFKYSFWSQTQQRETNGLRSSASAAVRLIGRRRPQLIVPIIVKCLTDRNTHVREFGERLFSEFAPKFRRILPPLLEYLDDKRLENRECATALLVRFGLAHPKSVVPQLIQSFQRTSDQIRQHATMALGAIVEQRPALIARTLQALVGRLGDTSADVRQQAADALYKLAERDPARLAKAVPALTASLHDDYHHVRWRAVMTIGLIGKEDPQTVRTAIPALVALMKDPYEHVTWRVNDALATLGVSERDYRFAVNAVELAESMIEQQSSAGRDTSRAKNLMIQAEAAMKVVDYSKAAMFAEEIKSELLGGTNSHDPTTVPPSQRNTDEQAAATTTATAPAASTSTAGAKSAMHTSVRSMPSVRYCHYCGRENRPQFKYCINCRRPLQTSADTTTLRTHGVGDASSERVATAGDNERASASASASASATVESLKKPGTPQNRVIYRDTLAHFYDPASNTVRDSQLLRKLRETLGVTDAEHRELVEAFARKRGRS